MKQKQERNTHRMIWQWVALEGVGFIGGSAKAIGPKSEDSM